jgi:hypothetical protein
MSIRVRQNGMFPPQNRHEASPMCARFPASIAVVGRGAEGPRGAQVTRARGTLAPPQDGA